VIGLGTARSAGENFGCILEHLGVPVTNLGATTTSLGAPATTLGAPRMTVEQSGKNNIFIGNAAGVGGNHSYDISFNDFQNINSVCILINAFMYLNSNQSSHGISGLAAGCAWEQFEVGLKMSIE